MLYPKGESILDLNTWKNVILPRNISCEVDAEARCFLVGRKLAGEFITRMNYVEARVAVGITGSFEVFLA